MNFSFSKVCHVSVADVGWFMFILQWTQLFLYYNESSLCSYYNGSLCLRITMDQLCARIAVGQFCVRTTSLCASFVFVLQWTSFVCVHFTIDNFTFVLQKGQFCFRIAMSQFCVCTTSCSQYKTAQLCVSTTITSVMFALQRDSLPRVKAQCCQIYSMPRVEAQC